MEKKAIRSQSIYCNVARKEVVIVVYEDGTCECKTASKGICPYAYSIYCPA